MSKEKDERIREAQGEKSKVIAKQNRLLVFLTLIDKPLTFGELLKQTGLSRPVLSKHLKAWQKRGSIEKDTVKQDETTNPAEIGKIVYRVRSEMIIPDVVRAIENALTKPNSKWDEDLKSELYRHYEGIASVLVRQWKKFHLRDRERR
jgi:DNA-binding transcriptional ArsR family regulator